MKRFKIIDGNYKKDGLRIYNDTCPTLSARDYKEPKMVYEEIYNTIQQGHDTNNQGGGRSSVTEKHCWDLIKEIDMIENKPIVIGNIYPSGGQNGNIFDTDGISPTLSSGVTSTEGNGGIGSCNSPKILIKANTIAGSEIANEGDSINFSNPNSKTRRGRVGVAQTLDTQVNQAVVVAQRGRGEKGSIEQKIEQRNDGSTNTLTGVQKDNMLLLEGNIRRLTEREVERLQGFADDWTKYGNYDGVIKEISRTQRYKLCGNAVTVDIVELIANKIEI